MKPSKRNTQNQRAKDEKRAGGPPRESKYAAKVAAERTKGAKRGDTSP